MWLRLRVIGIVPFLLNFESIFIHHISYLLCCILELEVSENKLEFSIEGYKSELNKCRCVRT